MGSVTVLCCNSGTALSHLTGGQQDCPSFMLPVVAQGNTEVGYLLITVSKFSLLHAIPFSKSCDTILGI